MKKRPKMSAKNFVKDTAKHFPAAAAKAKGKEPKLMSGLAALPTRCPRCRGGKGFNCPLCKGSGFVSSKGAK